MDKFTSLVKELRLFIGVLLTIGGVGVFDIDTTLTYVANYNIHLMILTSVGIYINHFLSNKRHKLAGSRLDLYQQQLNEVILQNSVSQLRAEVRQAFKDYNDIKVIDFVTTIKYLNGLEERRVELGVNSYTEDMMKILLDKIKL